MRRSRWKHVAACALGWLLAVCMISAPASAQGQDARPWAAGVTESEQVIALEIYDAGNLLFKDALVSQALTRYRVALRHWDHPAIRFNIAVCLIQLGHFVEARENLERSLAYGANALGADAYNQGNTYRKLLDAQLVRVVISSPDRAEVTLDGKLLFTGPGSMEVFVAPGEHHILATKAGQFAMTSQRFTARTGERLDLEIRLPSPFQSPPSRPSRPTPQVSTPKLKSDPWDAKAAEINRRSSGPLVSAPAGPADPPAPPPLLVPSASVPPSGGSQSSPAPREPDARPESASDVLATEGILSRSFDGGFLRPPTPPRHVRVRDSAPSPPAAISGGPNAAAGVRTPAPASPLARSKTSGRATGVSLPKARPVPATSPPLNTKR